MGEAIVFTSGKGGVGKTTTIANIGAGLSRLDKKVIMPVLTGICFREGRSDPV